MLVLVRIDLSAADLALFDAYEEQALALLPAHGGRLDQRLRAVDDRSETHLILFGDADGLAAFRADPRRLALQDIWLRSGAVSELVEVRRLS